jgi:PAS domain S-box-containing protein
MISTHLTKEELARKLRESQENLKAYVEDAPDGIYLADLKGTFLYGNKQAEEITGYMKQELIGKSFLNLNLLPPKYLPKAIKLLTLNAAGKTTGPDTLELVRKDGRKIWIEIKTKPITQFGKTVVIGSVRDITERKKMEDALQISDAKYKDLYENAPVAYYSVGTDGSFKESNKAAQLWLGFSPDELRRMRVTDIYAEESRAKANILFARFQQGTAIDNEEMVYRRKNGEKVYGLLTVSVIKDERGQVVVSRSVVKDITERKQAEEALRQSEESHRVLFETMVQGVVYQNTEGHITSANHSAERILGLTLDQMLGRTSIDPRWKAIHEDGSDFPGDTHPSMVALRTGKEVLNVIMGVFHHDKNEYVWININAIPLFKQGETKPHHVYTTFEDFTGRKQADQVLRESKKRFELAMLATKDGLWEWDILNDHEFFSPRWCEIIGYSFDDPELPHTYNSWASRIHPDDIARVTSALQNHLEKGTVYDIDYRHRHKSGEYRWQNSRGQAVFGKTGKPIKMVGCISDITERKQTEEALKNSEERFRRLAENARDIIFRYRQLPSLGFDYISPAVLRISGYTPEELYADPLLIFKVVHPDSRSLLEEITSRPQDYLEKPVVFRWVRKDGEIIWTEQRSVPIYDKDGKIIANEGIIRDITERKHAEEQLRESEENLQTYLDNAPEGVCLYDLQGVFLYGNKMAEEILGYRKEELIGESFLSLNILPAKYLAKAGELLAINATGRVTGPDEFLLTKKDGNHTWVEISTTPIKQRDKTLIISFVRDINERKQADEALKASEESYRNSIDTSPMGVKVVNRDEGIIYANRAMLDIYGYSSIEELRNNPIEERYTPESYAEYLVRSEKFRSGEVTSLGYELSIRRKDGAIRHLQAFCKEIIWGGKKQFQLLYIDITERKKAEDEMRESRARFRELARLLPLGIWETDANGTLTYTNEEAMRAYGYSRQDIGITSLQTVIPQDRDRMMKNTQRILQGETPGGSEYTALRKDGSTFPSVVYASAIIRNGKGVGLRGITVNTTEQKIAGKRLEQAAQEWRTTFDSITDMVCILDKDSRIMRVNRAFAKMLKKEPQELLGKVCYEMIHKTDCPRHDCPHQKTLQTGKPAMAEYFEPTWGFYVEESTSPVFNENGDVKGSVCVIRDINERRRMQEQLMLTDRLASIGELASGVAHELNNPLTSVIGFSQLLMEGKIPDNIKEDLSLINSEALRAASVVKNLLTFARKHAPSKQLCQMHNIIEDVLKLRAYEQKVSNIEVIKKFASDLPEIMVDYFQIQQAFLNLIINAEFFMTEAHHRGTLTISIERVDHAVRISFTDDGAGIPRENLKRIFDPFFTTKEVGKGTGLGLSICHGIITEHGGKIYAESEVGKGATFIIELPINGH